jgi:hypothetical protein
MTAGKLARSVAVGNAKRKTSRPHVRDVAFASFFAYS